MTMSNTTSCNRTATYAVQIAEVDMIMFSFESNILGSELKKDHRTLQRICLSLSLWFSFFFHLPFAFCQFLHVCLDITESMSLLPPSAYFLFL